MGIKEAMGDVFISVCRPEAAIKARRADLGLMRGQRVEVGGADLTDVLAPLSYRDLVKLFTWLEQPICKLPPVRCILGRV